MLFKGSNNLVQIYRSFVTVHYVLYFLFLLSTTLVCEGVVHYVLYFLFLLSSTLVCEGVVHYVLYFLFLMLCFR